MPTTTHGHTRSGGKCTSTYRSWLCMKTRCENPNDPSFPMYGGRGILICSRWRNSFSAFLHDMGERPKGTSLDRIDNSRGYFPDNCRWSTPKQQIRNRTDNRLITFNGLTKCLAEWAEAIGVSPEAMSKRLKNWSVERAMTEPANRHKRTRHRSILTVGDGKVKGEAVDGQ